MVTPRELHRKLTQELEDAGIPDAAFDVQCMMEQVTNRSFHRLMHEESIPELAEIELYKLISHRKRREPLQYLLGEWEFYGMRLFVGEGVLIPRPDTEALVDTVLSHAKTLKNPEITDLCSGSGCIALALQEHLPQAKVHAVEKSEAALSYLYKNAEYHKSPVNIHPMDVLAAVDFPKLDIIVSNPPYLTAEEMRELQAEVRHEPEMALYGITEDGLYFYREITRIWKHFLKSGGMLAYEVGDAQAEDVAGILAAQGFTDIRRIPDLAGNLRVVTGFFLEETILNN